MSVSEPGGNTVYEYEGDGTRISKTQNAVETKYINDIALPLVQVLMETDNAGAVQATYTYGNDLVSMNRAGADSYYHYDGLGSTRQLTDSSGIVTVSYTYDSFGNLIASTGTSDNTYGFTGEQQFGEADGLVFLRARYYDPRVGRFLQTDPIGYVAGLNLYTYVKSNPINKVDPTGLAPLWNTPSGAACDAYDCDGGIVNRCKGKVLKPSAIIFQMDLGQTASEGAFWKIGIKLHVHTILAAQSDTLCVGTIATLLTREMGNCRLYGLELSLKHRNCAVGAMEL